jgi:hypothetical protein
MRRSVIGRSSAFLSYQPLKIWFGATLDPPRGLRVPQEHENRPDSKVGRLHYSLRPHPKCPIQVGASARPSVSWMHHTFVLVRAGL